VEEINTEGASRKELFTGGAVAENAQACRGQRGAPTGDSSLFLLIIHCPPEPGSTTNFILHLVAI